MPATSRPGAGPAAPRPLRSPYLWIAVVALAAVVVVRVVVASRRPAPRTFGAAPHFRLVDQSGRPFGSDDLRGRVYVVSFFFTSCVTLCPLITGAVKKLQARADAEAVALGLVSITVDPATDTPEQLAAYAGRTGVDLARWHLLTGTAEAIEEVVVGGFKTHLGERATNADGVMDIAHGARLVLVDARGHVRGTYDTDDAALDELFRHARQLVRDAP